MPDPLTIVYQLALRALEEQERQVTALHGRLAPVIAAVGVASTLLAPTAFRGDRPDGAVATLAACLGVVGVVVTLLAAAFVLIPRRLTFAIDASLAAIAFLQRPGGASVHVGHLSIVAGLDELRVRNRASLRRLHAAFTFMLCGMLVAVCGLSVAAAVA